VESDSAFTPREERLRARINAWWFFIGLIFGAFLTAAIALLFLVP
jgi:predicted CDP-diglyceride synthetase/phosphatidate cytidylyltransferase